MGTFYTSLLIAADISPPSDAGDTMIPVWLASLVVVPLATAVVALAIAYFKDRQSLKDDAIKAQSETITAYKNNTTLVEKVTASNETLKASMDALTKAVDKLGDSS